MLKKVLTISFILLLNGLLIAQNFTKIEDASNPVATAQFPINYSGAAWVDVDNDGNIDLFTTENFLFKNLGNGNFERVETIVGSNQTSQLGTDGLMTVTSKNAHGSILKADPSFRGPGGPG